MYRMVPDQQAVACKQVTAMGKDIAVVFEDGSVSVFNGQANHVEHLYQIKVNL